MQISRNPSSASIDPASPFPRLGPGRNRRRLILGVDKVLRDSLRRCRHAVERLARIEAVVQIEAGRRDVVCGGDQRAVSGPVALGLHQGFRQKRLPDALRLGFGPDEELRQKPEPLGHPAEAEANDSVAMFRDPEPVGVLREAEFRKCDRRRRRPWLPAMAHAQLVARLLDNALGVFQIFELCRPIGDVHCVCPFRLAALTRKGARERVRGIVAPQFACSDLRFWRPPERFRGTQFDGTNYRLRPTRCAWLKLKGACHGCSPRIGDCGGRDGA